MAINILLIQKWYFFVFLSSVEPLTIRTFWLNERIFSPGFTHVVRVLGLPKLISFSSGQYPSRMKHSLNVIGSISRVNE